MRGQTKHPFLVSNRVWGSAESCTSGVWGGAPPPGTISVFLNKKNAYSEVPTVQYPADVHLEILGGFGSYD